MYYIQTHMVGGGRECLLAFVLYLMIFNEILRHFNDCHEGERQWESAATGRKTVSDTRTIFVTNGNQINRHFLSVQ